MLFQKFKNNALVLFSALLFFSSLQAAPATSFRSEQTQVTVLSDMKQVRLGDTFYLALQYQLEDNWHTYSDPPGNLGYALKIHWSLPSGFEAGQILWPKPKRFDFAGVQNFGYKNAVMLLVPIHTSDSFSGSDTVTIKAKLDWLVCNNVCIPESFQLVMPLVIGAESQRSKDAAQIHQHLAALTSPEPSLSPTIALIFAFLGGLLLNIMPCVFPVLSLKALSIVSLKRNRRTVILHSLAYTIGIVISFWLLVFILLFLQKSGQFLGWGFHLQSPVFILFLSLLFIAIALHFLDCLPLPNWLLTLPGRLPQWGSKDESLSGAFLTGVLATVVASPCTAPFMAPALGFALTQALPMNMAIFTALGLGLAAPLVFLTLIPRLHRFLPKPGPWLIQFRKWLSLPLFLTAAWLFWVLAQQQDLFSSFSGSLLKQTTHQQPIDTSKKIQIIPFSQDTLNILKQGKKPVFVEVTAAWCLTCQFNKISVLNKNKTARLFQERNTLYMLADWTERDDEITVFLNTYQRQGVPFYIYFPGNGKAPVILPEILSFKTLETTLSSD